MTDIEDALKRLENLIQEEHRMATAQVLGVTRGLEDGAQPHRRNTYVSLTHSPRCEDSPDSCTTDSR